MNSQPLQKVFQGSQARLTYFEWGTPGHPIVVLAHATGFHGRVWDQTVMRLRDRHVFALDMRGHGRSDKVPPYSWETFGRDLAEIMEGLDLKNGIGVGHSLGGYAVSYAAALSPARFDRLVLLDPVIFEPDAYQDNRYGFARVEDHPVSRRREKWTGWEAMYERFKDRHPYSLWVPQTLKDYCRYGLIESGDGFMLACPAKVEAAIYMGHSLTDVYALIKQIQIPVAVLRAQRKDTSDGNMDFSNSPTWKGLAETFAKGRDVYLPHLTHFIPMQDPDLVARFVLDADARS